MTISVEYKTKVLTEQVKAKLYSDIVDFRQTFGLPVEQPEGFNEASDSLHTSLWFEELKELFEADCAEERLDSAVDQVYVLVGRVVEKGFWGVTEEYICDNLIAICLELGMDFYKGWDIVQESNLSKTAATMEQVEIDIAHYKDLDVEIKYEEVNGRYVLKCAKECMQKGKDTVIKEGKVMKSTSYKKADLSDCVK